MKFLIPLVFLSIFFGPPPGSGAEGKGQVAPKITLPVEAAGWKWDGKESTYTSRTVFDYIDGAAELYLAYGFQGLKVRPGGRLRGFFL
jgi:hypothetical protein